MNGTDSGSGTREHSNCPMRRNRQSLVFGRSQA